MEAVSLGARASSDKLSKFAETSTDVTPANSGLFSFEILPFEWNASSHSEMDSQMTPAKCQEAMVCGMTGPFFFFHFCLVTSWTLKT